MEEAWSTASSGNERDEAEAEKSGGDRAQTVEEEEGGYESPPSAAEADGDYELRRRGRSDNAPNEPSSTNAAGAQKITELSRTMSRTAI